MGQLAFSLVGAGIGMMFGAPQLGWLLGGLAGSLLDPPKVYGPKLQDTKVRGGDYGQMRLILFGMCRIGGLGMGQGSTENGPNEFTEHEEEEGGKGGPTQINYRYTLSFANEICEGPIIGVQRRWANGRLITDVGASSNDIWPYTLYLGDTSQMPDPTMEVIYGDGEVTPLRGVAYESIEEINVGDFGNARPAVEYEAYTEGGVYPWRVSTFEWKESGLLGETIGFDDGVITTAETNGPGGYYISKQFRTDGTPVGVPVETLTDGWRVHRAVANRNLYLQVHDDGLTYRWGYVEHLSGGPLFDQAGTAPNLATGFSPVIMNGYLYAVGGVVGGFTVMARHPMMASSEAPGRGYPSGEPDETVALDATYSATEVTIGTSDTGDLYVAHGSVGGCKLWKFSEDLTLVKFWSEAETAGTRLGTSTGTGGHFHVYKNQLCFNYTPSSGPKYVALVTIAGDFTLTDHPDMLEHTTQPVVNLGGGLMMDADGVFSLDPPPAQVTLASIVRNLLERGGLSSGQIDVTDLETTLVRGYVISSQMTVKNAIDTLRKGFYFDVTEVDGKVLARLRGHEADLTIPDEDLCAHVPGTEKPDPLAVERIPEQELPRTVSINYYDYDRDYQTGSQYWRSDARSESDVTLDLPIVFTATEALLRAQLHIHFAFLERDHFTFYVSDEYLLLHPTMVVVVRGANIRLTRVTVMPAGILKCEGVRGFAGAFTTGSGGNINDPLPGDIPGAPGSGQPPQDPPLPKADTAAILIDGPLVSEADSNTGFRAALYKDGAGSWSGAGLYKSLDGGTSYTSVASTSSSAVVGTVATALGSFLGGNVIDNLHVVRVTLVDPDATLSSTNEEGLQNGLNLFAYGTPATGWEFAQFQTATLVSPGVWDLSGLLRGRFGTEWRMASHAASQTFVLMATTIAVPGSAGEIGVSRSYKAVTSGTAIADATAIDFTNTGVAGKALSPVLVGGGRNAAGDLTINFVPRRRGTGGWPDGTDLPATDPANWQIEIATSSGYTAYTRAIGIVVNTYVYTAADQTVDFGSPQATVYLRVCQFSAVGGLGYFTRAAL